MELVNINAGAAGIAFPYAALSRRLRYQPATSPLAQGFYRALAATANHFARESHMDEMAWAAGVDPVEFRLRHLHDQHPAAVVEAAAARFGWSKAPLGGRGVGLAAVFEKGGRVATCAEVEVAGDAIRVTRLTTAYECGAVVNPDAVRNQIEGGMVIALGGALFERLELDHGRLADPALARYRVPRFGDAPVLNVVVLDRSDLPSAGAGETPLVATANAIFAATGCRRRSLPLLGDS